MTAGLGQADAVSLLGRRRVEMRTPSLPGVAWWLMFATLPPGLKSYWGNTMSCCRYLWSTTEIRLLLGYRCRHMEADAVSSMLSCLSLMASLPFARFSLSRASFMLAIAMLNSLWPLPLCRAAIEPNHVFVSRSMFLVFWPRRWASPLAELRVEASIDRSYEIPC